MAKKKKGSLKSKMGGFAKSGKKKGIPYFNPKNEFPIWKPVSKENTSGVLLDFLQYTVTTSKHPDIDLGAEKGECWFRFPYKVHKNVGSKNESIICLEVFGKKCPICEERTRLYQENAKKEDTTPLWPKERSIYIVVPLNTEGVKKVPHIWDVSDNLFTKELKEELEENEEYEDYANLDDGRTLKLRFKSRTVGDSKFPFAECKKIEFEKRKKQYGDEILEKVPNLDKVLIELSYKELHDKFQEIDEGEDEPLDDVKKSKRNTGKKDKCPSGMKFGIDTDTKKKCKKCDIRKACIKKKDK